MGGVIVPDDTLTLNSLGMTGVVEWVQRVDSPRDGKDKYLGVKRG